MPASTNKLQLMFEPSPMGRESRITARAVFEIRLNDVQLFFEDKLKPLPGMLRFWVESSTPDRPWSVQTSDQIMVVLTALFDIEERYDRWLEDEVSNMEGLLDYESVKAFR